MKADTKELIFGLIRSEFDLLTWSIEYAHRRGRDLIKATIELELIEQAKEMISDAKDYGYYYTHLLK
jgi:hypothetical protein